MFFRPEHQRYTRIRNAAPDDRCRFGKHKHRLLRLAMRSRPGSRDKHAIAHCLGQRRSDSCGLQNIASSDPRPRFPPMRLIGRNHRKACEPEIRHRPRRRPDVQRIARRHEHDFHPIALFPCQQDMIVEPLHAVRFAPVATLGARMFPDTPSLEAEAESLCATYAAIAAAMNLQPRNVLFFSDSVRELDAARAAGCATRLVLRPGNPRVEDPHAHYTVASFAAL